MPEETPRGRGLKVTWLVATAYLLLSVAATWPLLRDAGTKVAGGTTDPVLNAAVLVWNAHTTPFSAAWWNPPHFWPATGVVAFTENLIGISPFATPIYWLTGNPWLAYNLSVFITWPISAFAAYLLVRALTGREDAAFLGGLVFGFSPYRAVALPHIQTLATFGIAVTLLGAHQYLRQRRWPWLVLSGIGWLQQATANGYYVLYGGLFLALWWVYFCSRRETFKAGLVLVATWGVFTIPLVPMLLGYRALHEQYGLHRTYTEILYFSALTRSWFEVHNAIWLWRHVFPYGKDNLFPGLTVVIMLAVGLWRLLTGRATPPGTTQDVPDTAPAWPAVFRLRAWLAAGTLLASVAIGVNVVFGRIDTTIAGVPIKMTDMGRAVLVLLGCGLPLLLTTPRTGAAARRRSPLLFYTGSALVLAVLSFGPEFRSGDDVIWKPAPYGRLMALPGFDEVRVPTQLKMIDLLCLAVAGALAYSAFQPRTARRASIACTLVAAGLLLDGWMVEAEMAAAPEMWPVAEPADRLEPILELPLGDGDYGSTLRASVHRRRVLNGVSGYDPPHYFALKHALDERNPAILPAIASLGPFDIVVDGEQDVDGSALRFAAGAPGASLVVSDGRRTLFRIPQRPAEPAAGHPWPIRAVDTAHHRETQALMLDGDAGTGWADLPDQPDAWVIADLGETQTIGGVTEIVGDYPRDFPRHLVIETSIDRRVWETAWEGPTDAHAFLAFVREPRQATLTFSFAAHQGRYIRLRETAVPTNWRIQELQILAPAAHAADAAYQ